MSDKEDADPGASDDKKTLREQREANQNLILNALRAQEERELADAARASAEKDRARLFDEAGWGVAIVSAEGAKLQSVNAAFARMHGYTIAELVGQPLTVVWSPESAAGLAAAVALTQEKGHHDFEGIHLRKDGSRFPCLTSAMASRDSDGKLTASAYNFQDLTARTHLEARLAVSERLAALGTLTAGIAHEINNPLAYNLGNLTYALSDFPPLVAELGDMLGADPRWPSVAARCAEFLAALQEARDGAERVERIVADMKTLSQSRERAHHPVSLSRILDAALRMASHEIKLHTRLVKEIEAAPPVLCDEGKLSQVIVNLVLNATQSMKGRPVADNELRITLGTDRDGYARVDVTDNGTGIEPAVLPRIFDPFFTTKEFGVGSGLGLSVCHSIVAAHGGEITVASELGRGTTFRVRLPPSQIPLEAVVPTAVAPSLPALRLLIIDDEPGVGRTLRRALGSLHETVILASAVEAKLLLDVDSAFDVVISDLMMAEVSGIDLYTWAVTRHPSVAKRMIFMTGGAYTAEGKQFIADHPDRHIMKPFDIARLIAVIKTILPS